MTKLFLATLLTVATCVIGVNSLSESPQSSPDAAASQQAASAASAASTASMEP